MRGREISIKDLTPNPSRKTGQVIQRRGNCEIKRSIKNVEKKLSAEVLRPIVAAILFCLPLRQKR